MPLREPLKSCQRKNKTTYSWMNKCCINMVQLFRMLPYRHSTSSIMPSDIEQCQRNVYSNHHIQHCEWPVLLVRCFYHTNTINSILILYVLSESSIAEISTLIIFFVCAETSTFMHNYLISFGNLRIVNRFLAWREHQKSQID